ncbi:1944_t:CDS:2, partial [Racocetra fulgida]
MANYDDDPGEPSGQFSFNKQYEMSDNISISSSSNASIFDKNQSNKKKVKFFTKSPKRSEYLDAAQLESQSSSSTFLMQNQNITDSDMSSDSDDESSNHSVEENSKSSDDDDSSEDEDLELLTLTNHHRHQTRSVINTANQSNDHTRITQTILKTLQHTIYDSLFDYWSEPLMPGLLASLLDPRLKILAIWSEDVQDMAKKELIRQFKELIGSNILSGSSVLNTSENNFCH